MDGLVSWFGLLQRLENAFHLDNEDLKKDGTFAVRLLLFGSIGKQGKIHMVAILNYFDMRYIVAKFSETNTGCLPRSILDISWKVVSLGSGGSVASNSFWTKNQQKLWVNILF